MNIVIISASTRFQRLSHRVTLALCDTINALPEHTARILDLAEYRFPIMEATLKNHPEPPEGLVEFSRFIQEADAAILVSPEYNGSYTAALKNALDYLSENEFTRKVVGITSVSNGPMAGMRAGLAMQQLVLGVGGYPIPQMLLVGKVHEQFDENGQLINPEFGKKIEQFLNGFFWLGTAVTSKKSILVQEV